MTAAEAVAIRDRAKRLGLQTHCEECFRDIEMLNNLSYKTMTIPPSLNSESQRKKPVLGSAMENAARRLRRSIGAK